MYAYIYSTNCFESIQMEENHSHQGTVYADITNIGMDSVLKLHATNSQVHSWQ